MAPTLKIGILLKSRTVSNWIYTMFSELLQMEGIELAVLMYRKNSLEASTPPRSSRVLDLYRKIDRKSFRASLDAFAPRSIENLIKTDELYYEYQQGGSSLLNEDIDRIKAYDLDVILRIDRVEFSGSILELPRHGLWSIAPEDDRMNTLSMAGFMEVTQAKEMATICLQRHFQDPSKNKVLRISSTLTDNLSVERNNNRNFWKASQFVSRELNKILRLGSRAYEDELVHLSAVSPTLKSTLIEYSDWTIFKAVTKLQLRRFSKILWARFRFDQWILLFKIGQHNPLSKTVESFKQIIPPKDRFWADPFILKRKERYYVFLEELLYAENKGFISVMEVDAQGNYSDPVKIIEEDYHLSYPFIFEDNGQLFMIPETKNSKSIRLYKCLEFPHRWSFEKTLKDDVLAVDTTLAFIDNKYWMFTNVAYNKACSIHDELHLYYADHLDAVEWTSHPQNPIVSDVSRARPAGKLFYHEGSWYRPSQNCSKRYGYGLQINKILQLDEENYKEELVNTLLPDTLKNLNAIHTLNTADGFTVMDAQRSRSK